MDSQNPDLKGNFQFKRNLQRVVIQIKESIQELELQKMSIIQKIKQEKRLIQRLENEIIKDRE
jgi:hypothetical protein